MAELVDAPDLDSGGQPWGFKSLLAYHKNMKEWASGESMVCKTIYVGSIPTSFSNNLFDIFKKL